MSLSGLKYQYQCDFKLNKKWDQFLKARMMHKFRRYLLDSLKGISVLNILKTIFILLPKRDFKLEYLS